MSADDESRDARGPGRPRDLNIDRKVLAAALSIVAEEGYARLTMEGVAARTGVGKASLYRRWATKEALILDALNSDPGLPSPPDTGSVRGDMSAYLRTMVGYRRTHSQAISALSGEAACNPELGAAFRANILAPLLESLEAMVTRGVARGELPAGTDVRLLASVPPALLFQHLVLGGSVPDEQFVDRIVAQFFPATRAAAGGAASPPAGSPRAAADSDGVA